MKSQLNRDEEAVSAAIATVLLFGGVVSIIGIMLVSMVPIIEELEGSIERDDMSSQMLILAQQTEVLSEHGMPGDSTEVEIIPLDGDLSWDSTRGGMWYSSTWNPDSTFRMKGILDFDNTIEVKHPESKTKAICYDDLRLGSTRPFIYTIPDWSNEILLSVNEGLASPLGPVKINLFAGNTLMETIELAIGQIEDISVSSTTNYRIESSHELRIFATAGNGGASLIMPDNPSPSDLTGRSWSMAVEQGQSTLHILSQSSNLITLTVDNQESNHIITTDNDPRTGTSWSHLLDIDTTKLISVRTSKPARLILVSNDLTSGGTITLQSNSGAFMGTVFNTPELLGHLELFNPSEDIATVTWKGGGISIPGDSDAVIQWPPSGITGTPIIDSDKEISVLWHNNISTTSSTGISIIPAEDTGFSSGMSHRFNSYSSTGDGTIILQISGSQSNWNYTGQESFNSTLEFQNSMDSFSITEGMNNITVNEGHPIRVYRMNGNDGLLQLRHDGEQRCLGIDTTASGWITTPLPWDNMAGRNEIEVLDAWSKGTHPSSYSINLIGHDGHSEHAILASAWVFHISRLSYSFTSSVTGMEVAYSNGAVVTNHPEFLPTILKQPNDRSGPGPRFASTIPALNPTFDSSSGAGKMNLDIELVNRETLASETAYEVRRGWHSPYGEAIANLAASGLESSIDWTLYPGRLDLLTDYVGWVPDPSIGTSEAVWHTNGEPIQFSLQLASLDVTMTEVLG